MPRQKAIIKGISSVLGYLRAGFFVDRPKPNPPNWSALPPYISMRQAAEVFQVHPNTLRRWDRTGRLPAVRIGRRHDRRFAKDTIQKIWLTSQPLTQSKKTIRLSVPMFQRWVTLTAGAALMLGLVVGPSDQPAALAEGLREQTRSIDPSVCQGWSGGDLANDMNVSEQAAFHEYSEKNSARFSSGDITVTGDSSQPLTIGSLDTVAEFLTCQGWNVGADGGSFLSARLQISQARRSYINSTDTVHIEYSADGSSWKSVAILPMGEATSGYQDFALEHLQSLADVRQARIRFRIDSQVSNQVSTMWLDGVRLLIKENLPSTTNTSVELDRLTTLSKEVFQINEQPVITLPKERTSKFLWITQGTEQWHLQKAVLKDQSGNISDAPYRLSEQRHGDDVDTVLTLDTTKLRPGRFTLMVTVATPEGSVETIAKKFLWGVVALNVSRNTARPDQDQVVSLGILDDAGRTLCNAQAELTITDPRGQTQSFSTAKGTIKKDPECVDKGVTHNADYSVKTKTGLPGVYHYHLSATTPSGPRVLDENITVDPTVPFDVERFSQSTRIYPLAPYTVQMAVTARQDFTGTVQEPVPNDFAIDKIQPAGSVVPDLDQAGQKIIQWSVDWKKGDTYFMSYQYDAPDISPALFTTGPLKIGGSFSAAPLFEESRAWQIASDEVSHATLPPGKYKTLPEVATDWDATQENLIQVTKPIFQSDETVAIKFWAKNFSLAARPNHPVTLTDITIDPPKYGQSGFDIGEEVLERDGKTRQVMYLVPNSLFRPGEYTVRANMIEGKTSQPVSYSFEWGTLNIRSVGGQPRVKKRLSIAVEAATPAGNSSCDPSLKVVIKKPDGGQENFSASEGSWVPPQYCSDPAAAGGVFTIPYLPSQPGSHTITWSRQHDGTRRFVSREFTVAERKSTPKNVTSDIQNAVQLSQPDFKATEKPVTSVAIEEKPLLFGADITRQVELAQLIGPDGQRVEVPVAGENREDGRKKFRDIHLEKSWLTKPGKYQLVLTVSQGDYTEDVTEEFTWGVLAVNLRRSIERPNVVTQIGLAALDNGGQTLCDVDLTLEVINPDGKKKKLTTKNDGIKKNPDCVDKGVTNDFDHTAEYTTSGPGTYTLKLTSDTSEGRRTIDDTFEVKDVVDFDIERSEFSMRIYPLADYPTQFSITAHRDYQGPVQEMVPADFIIKDVTGQGSVEAEADGRQRITWTVDWKAGEKYSLGYTIDFPDVSPEYYQLGPLTIGNFAEARQWQIAADSLGNPTGTRLTTIGFELQSTTANMEYTANINTPVIDTTTFRSGAASLEALTASAVTEGMTYRYAAANSVDDYYLRAYINITSLPSTQTKIMVFADSTPSDQASIRLNTDGTLEVWNDEDTAQVGSDSLALSTGRWYRIELRADSTTIDSTILDGRIDGQSFASSTVNHGNGALDFSLGIVTTGATAEINFDDVALNNDSTTDLNWPGEGRVVHLRPNGTSANTCDAQANYHLLLDEVTPNDVTDTVLCDANADAVTVALDDSSTAGIPAGADIKLVHGGKRFAAVDASASYTANSRLTIGSTVETGTVTAATTSASYFTNMGATPFNYNQTVFDWTPVTGVRKITTTDLDAALIGYTATDAAPDSRVTALWAVVEYTNPEGGRQYSSGFELQSLTSGMEWTTAAGALNIDTTTKRSGAASLRVQTLGSGTEESLTTTFAFANDNGPYFFRTYLYFTTLPSAENRVMEVKNSSATVMAYQTVDNTGTLKLYDEDGQVTGTTTLSTATWYRLEMQVYANGASSVVEGRVDGVNFATSSSRNLSTGVDRFFVGGNLNAEAQTTGDWYFDDVAINKKVGIFESDYPGEGKIVHMRPNATGDNSAWAVSVGCAAVDYTCVDEVTPDDATTAVGTSTVSQTEDVNLDSATTAGIAATDSIKVVSVGSRQANSSTTQSDLRVRLKAAASAPSIEGNQILTNSATYFTNQAGLITPSLTVYEKPYVNTPWTPTDLDAAQVGMREMVDSASNLIVSAIWLQVEYQPPTQGRIYSSGFELQSTTAGMEYGANINTPTISTTTIRSGLAAFRTNPTASTQGMEYQFQEVDSAVDTYFRAYIRFTTAPDSNTLLMAIRDNAGTNQASIRYDNANNKLELWNEEDTAQIGSDSAAVTTGTWYRVEMRVDFGTAATGDTALEGKLDGTSFASTAVGNWANGVRTMQLGILTTTSTADVFFDDVAININAGSAQNGYPGAGSIVHMQPDADGDTVAWTNTYTNIDEVTPNDGTDSITSTTLDQVEEANLETSSSAGIGASDTITLVQSGVRFRNSSIVHNSALIVRVKDAASATRIVSSRPIPTASSAWKSQNVEEALGAPQTLPAPNTLTKRPDGTNNWTPTQLDGTQVGVQVAYDANSNNIEVTALWLSVEYVPFAGIYVQGTCDALNQSTDCVDETDVGDEIRVAINGTLDADDKDTVVDGSWSIALLPIPSTNDIVTIFINGASATNRAVAVTKYDGSGSITAIELYKEHLSIGSADNQTITAAEVGSYDQSVSSDADVFMDYRTDFNTLCGETGGTGTATSCLIVDCPAYSAGACTSPFSSTEELYITSGNTLDGVDVNLSSHDVEINGTLTAGVNKRVWVRGSWDNSGVFNHAGSVMTFTATTGTETIDNTGAGTHTIQWLEIGYSSGTATFQVISAMTVNAGATIIYGTLDLDTSDPVVDVNGNVNMPSGGTISASATAAFTIGGDFWSDGTFTANGGTVTFDATDTDNLIEIGAQSAASLTFSGASGNGKWTLRNDNLTATGTVTIDSGDELAIPSGLSFIHSGTTFTFAGTVSGAGRLVFKDASTGPGISGTISAITRYDASAGNIADTTFDARTYTNTVEIYMDNTAVADRTVSMSGTYNITGSTSDLLLIGDDTQNLTLDGSSGNPTVTIGRTLDFTGAGAGSQEAIKSGTSTWTVAGNVDFTGGNTTNHSWTGTLHMNNSGGKTLNGNARTFTNFTLTGSVTHTGTIYVTGTTTISASSTLTPGTAFFMGALGAGSVVLDSSAAISGTGTVRFRTSTISTGGNITSNVAFDVQDNGLTAPARSYGAAGKTFTAITGTSTVSRTLTLGATGSTIDIVGSIQVNDQSGNGMVISADSDAGGTNDTIVNVTQNVTTPVTFGTEAIIMGSQTWTVGGDFNMDGLQSLTHSSGTLVMNGTGTLQLRDDTISAIDHTLYNVTLSGTVTLANFNATIAGNLDLTNSVNTLTEGTSNVIMSGTGNLVGDSETLYDLTINGAGNTVTATSGLTVSNTLTIGGAADVNNDILTINSGQTVTASKTSATSLTIHGSGTDTIDGAGRLTYMNTATTFPTTGTLASIVRFDMDAGSMIVPQRDFGGTVEAYDDSSIAARTLTLGTAISQTINIAGSLHIQADSSDASGDVTVSGSTNDPAVNITGDVDYVGTIGATSLENIVFDGGTWTVGGHFDIEGSSETPTIAALVMNGTTSNLKANDKTITALTINGTNSTVIVTSTGLTVSGALTIGGDAAANTDVLSIASGLTVTSGTSGTVVMTDATDTISGAGRLTYQNTVTTFPTTGTISCVLRFDLENGLMNAPARTYVGTVEVFYDNTAGFSQTLIFGTTTGQTLNFSANLLIIDTGTVGISLDASPYDPAINIIGDLDSTGSATLADSISSGGGTWTVSGNIDLTNTFLITESSNTFVMNGASKSFTSNGQTFRNLTFAGTVATTWNDNVGANGNVILNNTINAGSTTLTMFGTSHALTGGSATLNNLTINPSSTGTITLQASDLTVTGTLNISANDTLSIDSGRTLSHTGATLTWGSSSTISGDGTLRFTEASGGPSTGGTLSAVTRFDSSNGDIADTTYDARTYSDKVELYANSSTNRTITFGSGTHTLSGSSSHLHILGEGTGDLTANGSTNSPTVTIGGDLDFTGTGAGLEIIAAGDETWTVSGNVNLAGGFYAPRLVTLSPTWDRTALCYGGYSCESDTATTLKYGNPDAGGGPDCFEQGGVSPHRAGQKFDLSSIPSAATITIASLQAYVATGTTQTVTVGRATSDTPVPTEGACTDGTALSNLAVARAYDYVTTWNTAGIKYLNLKSFAIADIQSRIGSGAPIALSIVGDDVIPGNGVINSNDNASNKPLLRVGYANVSTSPTLVMNGTGTLTADADYSHFYNLTLSGTINLASSTFYVIDTLNLTGGGTITGGTSLVAMVGATSTIIGGEKTLYNLATANVAQTVTLSTSDLTVSNQMTVQSPATLSVGSGASLNLPNIFVLNGTASGSGTIVFSNASTGPGIAGTLNVGVRFDATNGNIVSTTLDARTYGGAVEFYSNAAGSPARTITFPNSGTFTFSSTVTTNRANTGTITVDADDTTDPNITVTGALTIGANTTWQAPSSGTFNINGNYTNNGTFTDNSGTVTVAGSDQQIFSGTMTSSSDFNNLLVTNTSGSNPDSSPSVIFAAASTAAGTMTATTASTKLRFNTGSTYTFQNINFNGQASGTRVFLRSSSAGTQWNINVAGTRSVTYLDVKDSNACGQAPDIDANDFSNNDSGNNTCWTLSRLTATLSTNTIPLGTLVGTTINKGSVVLSVTTNSPTGFTSYVVYDHPLQIDGSNTVDDSSGGTIAFGQEKFGASSSEASGVDIGVWSPASCTTDTTTSNATALSTTPKSFATSAGAVTADTTTLCLLSSITPTTSAGAYSNTLTIVTTGKF